MTTPDNEDTITDEPLTDIIEMFAVHGVSIANAINVANAQKSNIIKRKQLIGAFMIGSIILSVTCMVWWQEIDGSVAAGLWGVIVGYIFAKD